MRLSVTTPRGALVEADVDEVTAPGALGEFGVLPGHVPFLSALQPGVFSFRNKDQTRVLAVSEGVLEVARTEGGGDKVLVLVSEALHAEEVDRDDAEKEVAAADAELARWNTRPRRRAQGPPHPPRLGRRPHRRLRAPRALAGPRAREPPGYFCNPLPGRSVCGIGDRGGAAPPHPPPQTAAASPQGERQTG